MTTRFYLPSYSAVAIQPAVDASWERSTGVTYGRASTVRVGSALVSFSVSENISNATFDGVCRVYVSDPLSSSGTLSGNVKGIIRCLENSTSANMRAQILIKVVSRDGTTVRGVALAHQTGALSGTNEFGVALTNRKFPLDWASSPGSALTSVSYSAGDRIVIEIGYRNDTANTTTFTATLNFGDNVGTDLAEDQTSTAANCPWIEFDATLAFEDVPFLAGAYVQTGAGTTANPSITVPTPFGGSQLQNDIVVLNVHHEAGSTVTAVPSGFVQIGTTQSSGTSEALSSSRFAKRIGATPDSGSYAFTLSASVWTQITGGIYRKAYELSTVDTAFESLQQANNGATQVTTSANQTTTPTGNNRLAIASCDFFDGGTVTPPTGFATSLTVAGTNNYAAFKHLNDTTAQSAQWTLSVADSMVSFLFAMVPKGATLGGGGTAFTQSFSGSVTPSGALVRQAQKPVSGSVTLVGSLVKAAFKTLTGAVTPAGLLVRQARKPVSGSVTPTGSAIVKQSQKPMTGSVTPTGSLVKAVAKALTGSVTPSGALSAVRVILKALSGSLTPSGTLVRQARKPLTGTVTPTGSLTRAVSKALTGAVTLTGSAISQVRVKLQALTGAITLTGSAITKKASKTLTGAATLSGLLVKQARKTLTGSVTPSGSLSRTLARTLSFAGSVTLTGGGVVKAVSKAFAGTVTATGSFFKRTALSFAGAVTLSGAFQAIRTGAGAVKAWFYRVFILGRRR